MPSQTRQLRGRRTSMRGFFRSWQAASRQRAGFDITLLTLVLILLALGLLMLLSSSYPRAFSDTLHSETGAKPLTMFNHQLLFAIAGIVIMYGLSWVPMTIYRQSARAVFVVVLLMLLAVLFAGKEGGHAQRWFQLGPVTFQPSEALKLAVILLFADMITRRRTVMGDFKQGLLPFVFVLAVPVILLGLQPHLSCIIIVGLIALTMMLIGGMPWRYLVYGVLALVVVGVIMYFATDHVRLRITAWLHPENFSNDAENYQVYESLLAIGSGGLTGLGPGEGRQKYLYLPESHNDYIFAIVCEELGLLGALAIMLLLALLLLRCVQITLQAKERFSFLVAAGITAHFGLQTIMNIAVVTNSIPCTGVSLPFFSYGGTALLMQLVEMGIMLSISRELPLSRAG